MHSQGRPKKLSLTPPSLPPPLNRNQKKQKKQTKEEEDSHRTGTSSRDATILSVFWVR